VVSLVKAQEATEDPGRRRELFQEALAILELLEREGRLSAEQQGWIGLVKGALADLE